MKKAKIPPMNLSTDPATAYAQSVIAGEIVAGPHVRDACARHMRDLVDGPKRGLVWDTAAAERFYRFCGTVLRLSDGQFDGRPFNLEPSQQFTAGSLFGWKWAKTGKRRFRRAYIEQGKGNGKALAVDTPIPTPTGWTTMGALSDGDEVLGSDGKPCRVSHAHPFSFDRDCYEVKFDDGAVIVASAEHLWETEHRRPKPGGVTIKTTREIAETLRNSNGKYQSANHSVSLCGALDLPEASFTVPPYVLGAWLGDGDSDCARLTCAYDDHQILEEIAACGQAVLQQKRHSNTTGRYSLSEGRGVRGNTLMERLRSLSVLRNKHIPQAYLRGSKAQRLALLQGLMDTDGSIAKTGQCEYTATNKSLADGVLELALSLGLKASLIEGRATLNGRDISAKYRVCFFAPWDTPVFKLARKAERQVKAHERRRLSSDRRIVACRPVPSVAVRCITVNSADSMFLCGREMVPTHNSPFVGAIGLYGMVSDGEAAAQIYAAGATKEQAGILFRDAVGMVDKAPALDRVIRRSGGPGREYNLAHMKSGSFFRPVSRETKKTGSGPRPHFALCDEVHEHPDGGVIEILERGFKFREQPLLVMITNSGSDRKSICWQERKHAVAVAAGEVDDDTAFAYVCALDDKDDPFTDPSCWIKANPLLGVTITAEYLAIQVKQAKDIAAKANGIRRLHFCQWTDAESAWISRDMWQSVEDPGLTIEDFAGKKCWGGLDLSAKTDLTAKALLFDDGQTEDGKPNFAAFVHGYTPADTMLARAEKDGAPYHLWAEAGYVTATPGKKTRLDFVAQDLLDDADAYDLDFVAYDNYLIGDFEGILGDMGASLPILDHPQGWNKRKRETDDGEEIQLWMPGSVDELETLIMEKRIRVHVNPALRSAVMSATFDRSPADLRRFTKHKSTARIDMAVALAMAVGAATARAGVHLPSYIEENGLMVL
jgi:phage terminase large subunit-like protein